MKVVAKEKGYYGGHLRMPGETFEFTPVDKPKDFEGEWKGDKIARWMEKSDGKAKKAEKSDGSSDEKDQPRNG